MCLLLEEQAEDDHTVAQGSGNGDAAESGGLVGDEVVPGHPALSAEVLGVVSSVDRLATHDESHTVSGGDVPGAPEPNDRQSVMAGDKPGVGGAQGLVADEILTHPGEAIPAQGRDVGPDHRLEADVAAFRDQHGGEADLEISDSGAAFVHMGEAICKVGASTDFKEDVGQITLGQPRLNIAPQRNEARWFLEPVEMRQDETVVLEAQVWIVRKVRVRPLVGGVKLFAEAAEPPPRRRL